ncbi:hypothetical protein NDU88_003244 [Pleurodeles waltl]|uniref:Uncharacterized protein n=1 Tax=Pleurodeles waltl TaxID=8319 RepID=A0AAV7Q9H4_PLEWA|nr:hypothetical protein NDU88_003244 [Pleurodeles waltl]
MDGSVSFQKVLEAQSLFYRGELCETLRLPEKVARKQNGNRVIRGAHGRPQNERKPLSKRSNRSPTPSPKKCNKEPDSGAAAAFPVCAERRSLITGSERRGKNQNYPIVETRGKIGLLTPASTVGIPHFKNRTPEPLHLHDSVAEEGSGCRNKVPPLRGLRGKEPETLLTGANPQTRRTSYLTHRSDSEPRAGLTEKQTHRREVRHSSLSRTWPSDPSLRVGADPPRGTLDNRRVKAKGVIINSRGSTLKDLNGKQL